MTKRTIGIDISNTQIHAVQLLRDDEKYHIEKVFNAQLRRSTDLLENELKSLFTEKEFDKNADVAVSIPQENIFFRNIEVDSNELVRITQADSPILRDNFPLEVENIIPQICSQRRLDENKYMVLLSAVNRKALNGKLGSLSKIKIKPVLVEPAIAALYASISINHPEIMTGPCFIVYLSQNIVTLAIIDNASFLIIRNIPVSSELLENTEDFVNSLSGEIDITCQKVYDRSVTPENRIYLYYADKDIESFDEALARRFECSVINADPCAQINCPTDQRTIPQIGVAEGLALTLSAPERIISINFLDASQKTTGQASKIKKDIMLCILLLLAIIFVSFTGLFLRLFYLENKNKRLENELKTLFKQALPDTQVIVNPLAQVEQAIGSLKQNYSAFELAQRGYGALEVFHAITAAMPENQEVKIDTILISTQSARLTGTCRSFKAIDEWKNTLSKEPIFENIEEQNIQKDNTTSKVNFTVVITLGKSEP